MSCFVNQKNVFKNQKILQMLLMTSYVCNKAKHIRTTNKFRKVAIVEREARSKHGVRQAQPSTLFKKIHFKGLWQKLNVCSM